VTLSAPKPETLPPAPRSSPLIRRGVWLSLAVHGAAMAFLLLRPVPDTPETPLPSIPVDLVTAEAFGDPHPRPAPSVAQAADAVLASALTFPKRATPNQAALPQPAKAEAPQPEPPSSDRLSAPPMPATAWPRVPVRIRPPRLTSQVSAGFRAPDEPPPIPPMDRIDLEKGLAKASAPSVPTLVPAQARPDNPAPPYPSDARRRGLQGSVLLRVTVSTEGRPAQIALIESSGWAILDDAALEAVQAWRFEPARRQGQPVEATVEVPVVFQIGRN